MAEQNPNPDRIVKRLNVAINTETVEILERMIIRDGVSLTEAVRRLIGVGDAVTNYAKNGAQIVARDGDRTYEIVVF